MSLFSFSTSHKKHGNSGHQGSDYYQKKYSGGILGAIARMLGGSMSHSSHTRHNHNKHYSRKRYSHHSCSGHHYPPRRHTSYSSWS